MSNLTLHPLWHTAMPIYMHSAGLCTHVISAFAFYLMITKTPEGAKPFARYLMLLQATITLVDFNIGFLLCPISLQPIPGALCNGILCTVFGLSGHVGLVLMFLTVPNVAVSLVFCFHYRFLAILDMATHRTVSKRSRVIFRVFVIIINNLLCLTFMVLNRNLDGGPEYVRKNHPSMNYLIENPDYRSFVYNFSLYPGYTLFFVSYAILISVIDFLLANFFLLGSFYLLSQQTITFSEKTRQLQRNMMWLMIVQIFAPLSVQCVPAVLYGYSMISGASNPDTNNIIFCIQLTHGFIHTSVLILTTPSYRKTALFWRSQNVSIATLVKTSSNNKTTTFMTAKEN